MIDRFYGIFGGGENRRNIRRSPSPKYPVQIETGKKPTEEIRTLSKKRYSAEEIIPKLRESDVLLSQGKSVSPTCKQIGVSDQTYDRWRKIYGGMKVDQARRLKELEAENAQLKRAVADLTVDKLILKQVAGGKY